MMTIICPQESARNLQNSSPSTPPSPRSRNLGKNAYEETLTYVRVHTSVDCLNANQKPVAKKKCAVKRENGADATDGDAGIENLARKRIIGKTPATPAKPPPGQAKTFANRVLAWRVPSVALDGILNVLYVGFLQH